MNPENEHADRPANEGTHDAPGTRTVPCAQCGFNIVGRKIGEACPECGTPIGQYPVEAQGSNGKAVAALVLGIISIVTCTMWGIPAVICGPLAIHFGKQARLAVMQGRAPQSSLSIASAGRVCGIIGTCLGGVMLVFMILYFVFIIGVFGFAAMSGAAGGGGAPMSTP